MRYKTGFLKLGFAAVLIFCSAPAYASLVFSIQSVTASAGSTGNTLDVLLTNTGPSGVSIGGFNFEIAASDPAIVFTGVFTSTVTAPYVFDGDSLFGPQIDTQTSPTVIASDISASGSAALGSGATAGLGQIFFNVSPTAGLGPFTLSFTGGAAGNNLSDALGNDVPIDTFSSGSIQIGANAVPEPSSLWLTLAGIAVLLGRGRRLRRV
ncbi:MAG TPA: PEP-CTERM sorting domain-containing protein [Bryobacteraceae bacterium]|jgi:hypothetical protein|nr:PEP-CTERM sorting domain-containing protein [Bryobacteraceae bacterium]